MPVAGRLGKLPARHPVEIRFIEEYLLKGNLPKAPKSIDHLSGTSDWDMLGNGPDPSCDVAPQGVGDCACAGFVHAEMADANVLAVKQSWPTADEVVNQYLAYTGGQDTGVEVAAFLDFIQQHSFCHMTLAGYAPAHATDLDEVKSIVKLFETAGVGVQLPAVAMDQFESGQTWDLTGDESVDSNIIGGHYIMLGAYHDDLWGFVTWGAVQWATTAWVKRYMDEAWALLTDEFAAAKPGLIDYPALLGDLATMRNG